MKPSKVRALAFIVLIFFLSTFLNCKIKNPSRYELRPLEGKIVFSITEGYENYESPAKPRMVLSMQTEKIYGCYNYTIESRVSRFGNDISVIISGIFVPEGCLDALGPARFMSFLDFPVGKSMLGFYYRGDMDIYEVDISDSSIKIVRKESKFTESKFPLVWRYPPNSFVYLCGTTTNTNWACEDFLDTLLSAVVLEEFQFPDSGQIPYPTSACGYQYDMPAKYFLYEKEEDFDKAGQVLRQYYQAIGNPYSIDISLSNWMNRTYGALITVCEDMLVTNSELANY